MIDVHQNQSGLCGIYTFDIAESKVLQVEKMAKSEGFPLKAVMQEL
jgi:ATP-dependent Clp protease adaptor protein ClpS